MTNIIFPVFAFLFGSAVGSFLNVCIYRLPRDESIVFPGSHCPHCNQLIRFYDNIPIISYLLLRGKCRFCGSPISIQYPFVEATAGTFSVLFYLCYPLLEYAIYFTFFSSLLVVTMIDLKHQIIPDIISIPGIGVGFFASFALSRISYLDSLLGIALGGGILYGIAWAYHFIMKTEGMGGGDIKLLAMIGAFLGGKAVLVIIFLSSFFGSLVGLAIMVLKRKGRRHVIPYGPFLSLGAIIYLFCGDSLIRWYQELIHWR
ncbi:MAG: prepilin peptidase [Proteobacteria bacterium]|nr:prepilin peptidase [Pseudomonadota bacterium]